MIDVNQMLLAFMVLILTVILSVIGVQVYFVLREFRDTIHKVNKVLDDTGQISESVSKPISMLSAMIMGIRGSSSILKMLTKDRSKGQDP